MSQVNIITSFYNAEEFLDYAIKSVCNQTQRNFTYYVTDDFSDDNTKEKLLDWCKRDSRIKYVDQEYKQHMYWNPQHFVDTDAEFFIILDGDDTLTPNAVELISNVFVNNSSVGIVHTNSLFYHGHISNNEFDRPRYVSLYPFFDDWLSFHQHYMNNLDYRFGETWGGLRCYRNYKELRSFDFRDLISKGIYKHEDLLKLCIWEEMGDSYYLGRCLHSISQITTSNSRKYTAVRFNELWNSIKDRRNRLGIKPHGKVSYLDNVWELIYPLYYTNLEEETNRQRICIMSPTLTDYDIHRLNIDVFPDHIVTNSHNRLVDYYSITAYSKKQVIKYLDQVFCTYRPDQHVQIQILNSKTESDLNFDMMIQILNDHHAINRYSWHIYANEVLVFKIN